MKSTKFGGEEGRVSRIDDARERGAVNRSEKRSRGEKGGVGWRALVLESSGAVAV
jgi:hypothetical protein